MYCHKLYTFIHMLQSLLTSACCLKQIPMCWHTIWEPKQTLCQLMGAYALYIIVKEFVWSIQHNAFTYCDQITQYQIISCSGNNWICNYGHSFSLLNHMHSSSQNIDIGHMRIPKLQCSLVLWAMPNGWECALTIVCHTILHCNPTAWRYTSQVYWLNTVIWWQVNPLYPINFYFVVFSKYPSLYP